MKEIVYSRTFKIALIITIIFFISLVAMTVAAKPEVSGHSPDLTTQYNDFNFTYFYGRLPKVDVLLTTDDSFMGETDDCGKGCWTISISRPENPAPKEQSMTLLHEMCHVATPPEFEMHGPKFQACMHRLANLGAFDLLW